MRALELFEANIYNLSQLDEFAERTARVVQSPEARKWLVRQIRQYFLNSPTSLPGLLKKREIGDDDPEWAKRAYAAGELYLFWPRYAGDQFRHVLDYLVSLEANLRGQYADEARRRLSKLSRMTLHDVERQSDAWFALVQSQAAEEDADGVVEVTALPGGLRLVEIVAADCLDREGNLMQHCVGGGGYDEDLGKSLQIFSIRDRRNRPHVTIEVRDKRVVQVKGKQNEPPVRAYWAATIEALNAIGVPPETGLTDIAGMQVIYHDGRYDFLTRGAPLIGSVGGLEVRQLGRHYYFVDNDTVVHHMDAVRGLGTVFVADVSRRETLLAAMNFVDSRETVREWQSLVGPSNPTNAFGFKRVSSGWELLENTTEPLLRFSDGSAAYEARDLFWIIREHRLEMFFDLEFVGKGYYLSWRNIDGPLSDEQVRRDVAPKLAALLNERQVSRLVNPKLFPFLEKVDGVWQPVG